MKTHTNPRRVAFKLDLLWPHKHHAGIFAGAQRFAQEHGWESTIDEFVEDKLDPRPTAPPPYDGIIARTTPKLAERAALHGIPLVNTLLSSPAWQTQPAVFPDCRAIGRLYAEHLLSRGLKRFASLISPDRGAQLISGAFRDTVRQAGFDTSVVRLPQHPNRSPAMWQKLEQRIITAMQDWQPPIGVFAYYEGIGRTVAQFCRGHGWRVPHDVAIVAGANEESQCVLPRPSLTSIEVGYERIGYEAARMLSRLMDEHERGGPAPNPAEQRLIPPQRLVVRESTDFYAINDPQVAGALAYIADHSHRPITAQDVAESVGVGLRTLQLSFKRALGRPISAEIQRVRIERAKRELTQSSRPIQTIARDTGFGRAMRLYNVFRRELGVSPRAYRKQRQLK